MKKIRKPEVKPNWYRGRDGKRYQNFMVVWYDEFGDRQRVQKSTKSEAKAFAEDKYTQLLSSGHSRRHLSTVLEEPTLRLAEMAVEQLGGRYTLDQVVRYF